MTKLEPKKYGALADVSDNDLDFYREAIRIGMPKTKAVDFLHVAPETWAQARKELCDSKGYDWHNITLGEIELLLDTKKLTQREQNILKILAIEKSSVSAEGQLALLARIRKAADDPKYWGAAKHLLELQGYTVKQDIHIQGETNNNITITWTDEVKQAALKIWEESGAGTPELEAETIEEEQ